MASLAAALDVSALETAYYDASAACRIVVRKDLDGRTPDSPTKYVVTVQRGGGLPQSPLEAPDLEGALAQLRALNLPGFDPASDQWQPATSNSSTTSATWADETVGRGLLHQD